MTDRPPELGSYQPPLGGIAPAFQCNRLMNDDWENPEHCGQPPTHHIIWNSECENGIACDEHTDEIRRRWVYLGIHPYETVCSMPGAVYLFDENRCVVDEGLLGLKTDAKIEMPVST